MRVQLPRNQRVQLDADGTVTTCFLKHLPNWRDSHVEISGSWKQFAAALELSAWESIALQRLYPDADSDRCPQTFLMCNSEHLNLVAGDRIFVPARSLLS